MKNKEFDYSGFYLNGFVAFFLNVLFYAGAAYCIILTAKSTDVSPLTITAIAVLAFAGFLTMYGYIKLEPNEAKVLIFFGKYKGTFRKTGFYWINPFMTTKTLSLRARNLDAQPIKVNDKMGNPILIGMVIVWKLKDTYKAMFEIDAQTMSSGTVASRMQAFEKFVSIQGDAALRQVAGQFAYDNIGDTAKVASSSNELTLRSGGEEINEQLEEKLNERLEMAGIEVQEARLNYLTYAPEIAAVMLRRQQASAVIAAREKIVEGAVGMVQMALHELNDRDIVKLNDEQKSALVSNLLVVLCADETAQPVVNTGQ